MRRSRARASSAAWVTAESPADVADVDRPGRGGGVGAEAQDVGGERQVGTRLADDAGHLGRRMLDRDEEVVEVGQQLDQVLGQLLDPDLADQAHRALAAGAPVRYRGQGEELEGMVEHREEELVLAIEPGHAEPRQQRPRHHARPQRLSTELVQTPGPLDRLVVVDLHPVCTGDGRHHVLELVGRAERHQVMHPAHRQLEHRPSRPGNERGDLASRSRFGHGWCPSPPGSPRCARDRAQLYHAARPTRSWNVRPRGIRPAAGAMQGARGATDVRVSAR